MHLFAAQPSCTPVPVVSNRFPSTRYQGSKRKTAWAIVERLRGLRFTTVLDAFGGTAAVAHTFKVAGKAVTYNDHLAFNHQIGLALIENDSTQLDEESIEGIGRRRASVSYPSFIENTFEGIYFTTEEHRWLDTAATNIGLIDDPFRRALAWFALFQSAMAKRPYNLFHRSNLYMRLADVRRGFGNKTGWDRSFPEHFRTHAAEANAAVIRSARPCRATCRDVFDVETGFDLVYIDPPYVNRSGVGVDYRAFYHFLEGMVSYPTWAARIDRSSKHRRLLPEPNPWTSAKLCHEMFQRLFENFRGSTLAVSYRSDGIPSLAQLIDYLKAVKRRVTTFTMTRSPYVLSTSRRTREVLLIGTGSR